jgi:hypothetical protein
MTARVSAFLNKITNGWTFLLSAVIFLLFLIFILPWMAERTSSFAGDAGSIDTKFFYTGPEIYRIAEAYGEDGRKSYALARVTFDLVFPLAYTFFLAVSMTFTFRYLFSSSSTWQRAPLFAIGTMLFDFLENIAIVIIMLTFPARILWLGWLTAVLTMLKWVLMTITLGLFFIGIFGASIKWLFALIKSGGGLNDYQT